MAEVAAFLRDKRGNRARLSAMRRTPTVALLLLAACALPWAAARADRQMDPELRGVVAAAIEPARCFDDKYERPSGSRRWSRG